MEVLVMLTVIVETVVVIVVEKVMVRAMMLVVMIAIKMAMKIEMVVAVVMVIVMKTGTIDDNDGDDNMIAKGLIGLLTRSIIFYIICDFSSNTLPS